MELENMQFLDNSDHEFDFLRENQGDLITEQELKPLNDPSKPPISKQAHGVNQSFPAQLLLTDVYGDTRLTYSHAHIENPQGFALQQQRNYHCAQWYLKKMVKNSIYDDHDCQVLALVFKQEVKPHFVKLQSFLTNYYLNLVDFSPMNQEDLLGYFLNSTQDSSNHSILKKPQKEITSGYLQLLIAGAVLFRRSFEKIGVYYELNTQMRLNQDIAKMYKQLVGLSTIYHPFI